MSAVMQAAESGRERVTFGTLFRDALFGFWVLSVPFYKFSVVGSYSVDNLLAPVLFGVWLLSAPFQTMSAARVKQIWVIGLLCAVYILANVAGTVGSGNLEQFEGALRWELRVILYLLLPVLYVGSVRQFRTFLTLIVFDTLLVCLSALAFAFGLLDIGFTRQSRLEFDFGRSLGLVDGSGPFTALVLVTLVALRSASEWEPTRWVRRWWARLLLAGALLAGVVVSESRNAVLSSVMLLMLGPLLLAFGRRPGRGAVLLVVIGTPLFAAAVIFSSIIFGGAYDVLAGQGAARGSLETRWFSYAEAWRLILEHPFGATGAERAANDSLFRSLHSLWLGVLLKGGLLGLFALLGLLARAITGNWLRLRSGLQQIEASSLLALTVALAFSGSFFVAQHNLIYWLCLAVPFARLGADDVGRGQTRGAAASLADGPGPVVK